MIGFTRSVLAIVVLQIVAVIAFAQAPDPLLGSTSARTPMPDSLLDPVVLPTRTMESQDNWRLSADLGLPIGLRLQRRIGESNTWGEIGFGTWWIVPYVSACLRQDLTLVKRERNLFALRPGVSVTFLPTGPTGGVGLDCECIWQHTFKGNVCTELGVRLGLSAIVVESGRGRSRTHVFPVPIACLMWSWQF